MRRHLSATQVTSSVQCRYPDRPRSCLQVQDVGLIFLSAMASSIAMLCEEDGYEPREALGTSLLTLAISTFIVGILIVLVGVRSLL